jgi:hypothetical protein
LPRLLRLLALLAAVAACTGCASIVSGTNQSLSITSNSAGNDVAGAKCTLTNDKGSWFATTPGSVTVHRSFNDLAVNCTLDGLEPGVATFKSSTKGMAAGNILFGGLIGVGVDVSTGAAYDYPNVIQVSMGQPVGGGAAMPPAADKERGSASAASAPQPPSRPSAPAGPSLTVGTRITFLDSDPLNGAPLGESTFVVSELTADRLSFNDGGIVMTLDGTPVKGRLHGSAIYGSGPQQMARGGAWTGRFRAPFVTEEVPVEISMLRNEDKVISGVRYQAARLRVQGYASRENITGQSIGAAGATFNGEMLVDKATGLVLEVKVVSRHSGYSIQRSIVRVASS